MFGSARAASQQAGKGPKDTQETEPERILNLKKCCDLLVAGGYFRARITALSPFDRVIGGLVWGITASSVDLDVDIVFQENATIGQRIKIGENVIRALVKMKCPHVLHPQQIQGLDYPKLFDVIQWLVKQVFETRELTGDLVRALSESQFAKSYELPQDVRPHAAKDYVSSVFEEYKYRRMFKRKDNLGFSSHQAHAEAVLLEYGEQFYRAEPVEEADTKATNADFDKKRKNLISKFEPAGGITAEEKHKRDEEQKKAEEARRLEELKANLSELGAENKNQTVSVGGIVDTDAIDYYDAQLKQLQEGGDGAEETHLTGKKALEHAFQRQVKQLRDRIASQQAILEEKTAAHQTVTTRVDTLRSTLSEASTHQQQVAAESEHLEKTEKEHANQAYLAQLKALVALNESLKKQEAQFKASCKEQFEELQELMKQLESGETDEETQRVKEIERIYDQDLGKLNKVRQALAKLNQEIAKAVRAIDEIPTRAELIQYERRFVELYELVAEKLVETRKYFALYNTLEETHRYMTNEVSLLESISENFPKSVQSTKGMDAFLGSFKNILDGVEQNFDHVSKELVAERQTSEVLSDKYKKLLEQQRKYFKAVKEFQEECNKNEKLQDIIQRIAAAKGGAAQ